MSKPDSTRALALLLLALAPLAHGQDRTGFAVQGGIGASVIEDRDGDESFRGNALGYYAGMEYRFLPRFALGLDLFGLGRAEDTIDSVSTEIEVRGVDVHGRLIFPVNDGLEFYGRLGSAVYFSDVEPGLGGNPFGDDAVSLGAGVDIGREKLAFRIEGRWFSGGRDEQGALLTLGLHYRF